MISRIRLGGRADFIVLTSPNKDGFHLIPGSWGIGLISNFSQDMFPMTSQHIDLDADPVLPLQSLAVLQ